MGLREFFWFPKHEEEPAPEVKTNRVLIKYGGSIYDAKVLQETDKHVKLIWDINLYGAQMCEWFPKTRIIEYLHENNSTRS